MKKQCVLNIGELAKRLMNGVVGVYPDNGHECLIIELTEDEAREYAPDDFDNGYFGYQDDNGELIYGYYLGIDLETRGVACIDQSFYERVRAHTLETDIKRREEEKKLRLHLIDTASRPSASVPHRDVVIEAKRMLHFIETGNVYDKFSDVKDW